VYIIDEVHMLSNSAFNALLKTIEEPPPYVVFIFATTEIHKVPATIRSRCQQFTFRLFSTDEICRRLAEVARELELEADEEALIWIAKEAEGSLRDAYTTFDQIASFTGDGRISVSAIRDTIGALSLDELNQVGELIGSDDGKAMLALADTILERGVSVERCVIALADYLRSLLLLRHGVERPGILGYAPESFSAQARSRLKVSELELAGEMLLELHRNLKQSVNPRFEIELLLSRLARVQGLVTPDELLAEVSAIKGQFENDGSAAPGAERRRPTPPAPARPGATGTPVPTDTGSRAAPTAALAGAQGPPPPAGPVLADTATDTRAAPGPAPEPAVPDPATPAADGLLTDLSAQIRAHEQFALAASLERAQGVAVSGDRLTVTFGSRERYSGEHVIGEQRAVAAAAAVVVGRPVGVKVSYHREGEQPRPDSAEGTDVQRFLKVFRGEVVKEISFGT
jgi:DNA polymerase-3 subunit gamma/tau